MVQAFFFLVAYYFDAAVRERIEIADEIGPPIATSNNADFQT